MKLSKALEGYWLVKLQEFSPNTLGTYRMVYRRLQTFLGDVEFTDITHIDIRAYLAYIRETYKVSDRTLHDYWICLSSLWTWAEKEIDAPHVIRNKVKRPHFTKAPIEPFTFEQIKAMLKAAEYSAEWTTRNGKRIQSKRPTAARDKAILLTLLDCGLRASELCDMKISDYDNERGRLFVRKGKGNKKRILFIGTGARRAIWRYLSSRPDTQPDDPLFEAKTGRHLERNNLRHTLQIIGESAGVANVHPHRFRHTFAITFLRNRGSAFELQKMLGHESMETVMEYINVASIDLEEAQKVASPVDNWKL